MHCQKCGRALELDWEIRRKLCRMCQWSTPEARTRLDEFKREFGTHKKIVETATGIARAVPVEAIVVKGVKGAELSQFEPWDDAKHQAVTIDGLAELARLFSGRN